MGCGGGQHPEGDPELRPQPDPSPGKSFPASIGKGSHWPHLCSRLAGSELPSGDEVWECPVLPSRLDSGLLTLGVQTRAPAQRAQRLRLQSHVRAGPGAAGGPAQVCARALSAHPTDARQAGRERVAELHQGDRS